MLLFPFSILLFPFSLLLFPFSLLLFPFSLLLFPFSTYNSIVFVSFYPQWLGYYTLQLACTFYSPIDEAFRLADPLRMKPE